MDTAKQERCSEGELSTQHSVYLAVCVYVYVVCVCVCVRVRVRVCVVCA